MPSTPTAEMIRPTAAAAPDRVAAPRASTAAATQTVASPTVPATTPAIASVPDPAPHLAEAQRIAQARTSQWASWTSTTSPPFITAAASLVPLLQWLDARRPARRRARRRRCGTARWPKATTLTLDGRGVDEASPRPGDVPHHIDERVLLVDLDAKLDAAEAGGSSRGRPSIADLRIRPSESSSATAQASAMIRAMAGLTPDVTDRDDAARRHVGGDAPDRLHPPVEPMLAAPVSELPVGPGWVYELAVLGAQFADGLHWPAVRPGAPGLAMA
jgi:hypothetical protein